MIGDHQRASHSASRRPTRSPNSSSSGAFDSYHCGRSQPGRLEEDRAELALARVERREADVAVRLPLLERVDDPVGLVEALGGARLHVRARLVVLVEARDVRGVEVDLGLAVHHPLRKRLADARALLHPDRRRRPEALHLGRLAEDRHPVGGEGEDPVDRVLDADALVADDLRHQLERVLELRREVLLRERELGGRERRFLDRGQVLGVVQDRAVRVRADLERGSVLALVHVRVHVADDRELDRALRVLEARHRADVDHLVHGRRERDAGARHPRELRAPDAAGDDDDARLDVALGRPDAGDAAARGLDVEHLGAGRRPSSAPSSTACSRISVPARSESTTPTLGE